MLSEHFSTSMLALTGLTANVKIERGDGAGRIGFRACGVRFAWIVDGS